MIRINLLRQLEGISVPKKSMAKRPLWVPITASGLILGGLGVLLGVFMWPTNTSESIHTKSKGSAPDIAVVADPSADLVAPKKQKVMPKAVISDAVEDVVEEIPLDSEKKSTGGGYYSLSPGHKIQYQLSLCRKTLSYLKLVSSRDIGFTELTISIPGDMYIQGKAGNEAIYREFKSNLSKASFASIKPGLLKPFGADEIGREFSFYGKLRFSMPTEPFDRSAEEKEVEKSMKHLSYVAKNSGIKLSAFVLKANSREGGLQKRVYKIQASECSFGEFQSFINALFVGKSKFGFEKISLRAQGGEQLLALFDAVIYIR